MQNVVSLTHGSFFSINRYFSSDHFIAHSIWTIKLNRWVRLRRADHIRRRWHLTDFPTFPTMKTSPIGQRWVLEIVYWSYRRYFLRKSTAYRDNSSRELFNLSTMNQWYPRHGKRRHNGHSIFSWCWLRTWFETNVLEKQKRMRMSCSQSPREGERFQWMAIMYPRVKNVSNIFSKHWWHRNWIIWFR